MLLKLSRLKRQEGKLFMQDLLIYHNATEVKCLELIQIKML